MTGDRGLLTVDLLSHFFINKDMKNLKNRIFKCNSCNLEIDRDLNASINIHRVGASTLAGEVVRATSVA